MPLHVQLNLPPARALNIDDYEPSFAAYMRAAWGDADSYNPGTVAGNMLEASERRYGFNVMDVAEAGGLTGGLEELAQTDPLPAWSQEEQKAYIRDEGLEGALSPGEHYTRPELEFLARLKHEEIEKMLTREKASAWYAPFGFLAGLGASFTDPVNLATSLVPVLPEARMMQLLAKSGSAWGRAGIRAGVGAAEGAVGAAVVEPMIIGGKTELQQEYGLTNSLMNVVFGAAMGAVMKPAAGALGDWMRRKKGQRRPWEYVPSSDLTERLRTENAARIWEGMRQSGSEHLAPEHAEAAAALWDATLRGYAHDTGELVGDVYARYRTEWRGGKMEIVETGAPNHAGMDKPDSLSRAIEADLADANPPRIENASPEPEPEARPVEPVSEPAPQSVPDTVPNAVPDTVPDIVPEARRMRGAETSILNGQKEEPGHYELWELGDLIASHDPENQFAKRADYPQGVQERPYHSDAGEQEKVLRNAATLDPRYLVSDNPDAVNGPPLVTEKGIVLGGNSRTMSMQLAYAKHPERAQGYRNELKRKAALFGLEPDSVDGFDRPVLVRVVNGGDDADMAVRSRLYNQSQTQGLQSGAEGVSKARLLTPETLDTLTTGMEEFESLREFLASGKSKDFVTALLRDGVLEQTQFSRLTDGAGRLNDAGKDLVENTLRGLIVADYDVLAASPASVLNKLDRAVPELARLKARGEGWDMSGVVTNALREIARADKDGQELEIHFGQNMLFQGGAKPAVQAMALTFANATQKEVKARFALLARAAENSTRGQSMLFTGTDYNSAQEFINAFLRPVAVVDGEAIPRFSPETNEQHAALRYAYDHGGKGHTISSALDELQRTIINSASSAEEKARARARAMMPLLAPLSGTVAIHEPKLGQFFSYKKGDALFQSAGAEGKANAFGVPLNRVTRIEGNVTREEVEAALLELAGKDLPNLIEGVTAQVNRKQRGKLESVKASDKSIANGFTRSEHRGVAAQIANAWKWAAEATRGRDTKHGMPDVGIRRFVSALNINEQDAFAWITVKETPTGLRIYSVELMGEKKLREPVNSGSAETDTVALNRSFEEIVERLSAPVKESFLRQAENGINGLDGNTLFQSAYHGTPHRFDTFSLDAIGTGEGAQAHGSTTPEGAASPDTPRARVTFGEADAYAMVEFFKAADPSSAPHEMYHIFRRIMSEMYDDPNASEASRERYRKACEFVGAEPGKVWTREQEEMFARAGERFLLEGVTPNPRMGDVMESFKQWMGEVYGNAERSGLEISDGMRDVFGKMMGTAEDGDISFRYAMGKLLDYSPEKAIDTRVELPAEHVPEQTLEAYAQDSAARLEEAYSALADRPEAQERFRAELEAEMAGADAAVAEARKRGEIMQAAAACVMRG